MGIKYHQYGCGNDYGDDHYLTDNWNPDYDYGSQYVEVYFNINTPSYMHAKDSSAFGFASDETRDEWYAAASKVIASFDILEDSGYNVENSAEKRAYLYPHPQQISGVILKNDVRKVAEAIECMSLSSIRWWICMIPYMCFLTKHMRSILCLRMKPSKKICLTFAKLRESHDSMMQSKSAERLR